MQKKNFTFSYKIPSRFLVEAAKELNISCSAVCDGFVKNETPTVKIVSLVFLDHDFIYVGNNLELVIALEAAALEEYINMHNNAKEFPMNVVAMAEAFAGKMPQVLEQSSN